MKEKREKRERKIVSKLILPLFFFFPLSPRAPTNLVRSFMQLQTCKSRVTVCLLRSGRLFKALLSRERGERERGIASEKKKLKKKKNHG